MKLRCLKKEISEMSLTKIIIEMGEGRSREGEVDDKRV